MAIRTSAQIQIIINNGQHALANLTNTVIIEKKRGQTITKVSHRDNVYRMILLWVYLQNILEPNGNIKAYYLASDNEKKFNKILDGIVNLSKGFAGPAIALLGRKNLPLSFFPGTSGASSSSGGGPAQPGGTVFQGVANSPSSLIDTFNSSISSFVMYVVSVSGSNSGEGSRTSILSASWRGSNTPVSTETKTEDVGGITSPLTLKVELVGGMVQLNAYATTSNWTITGVRILFQNISFVNPIGPLPAGGTTGQLLAKSSNLDYQTIWKTLTANLITDLTASATELNFSQGVTSAIQTQLNTEASTRGTADTTLQTNINSEAVTRAAADLLRVLKAGDTMSGNLAMGGNKVTGLAAASSNGEAVRYEQLPAAVPLLFQVVNIGNWDMVATASKTIDLTALGIAVGKFRSVEVFIISDDSTVISPIQSATNGYTPSGSAFYANGGLGSNVIYVERRVTGGVNGFDNTAYDTAVFNRGYAIIKYAP